MGIRFTCPYCSRALNVKAAQAGLDAICPSCRQIIRIPDPAYVAVGEEAPLVSAVDQEATDEEQITTEGLDPISRQESEQLDVDPSLAGAVTARTNRRFRTSETEERAHFDLDKPTQNFQKGDPLSDAPDLIWYYRVKDQAERGPLKAKAIRTELVEGRIAAGSLVWREDWYAWLPVEQVFPGLFPVAQAYDPAVAPGLGMLTSWLARMTDQPRYLNLLILAICFVLALLIATVAWLILK